MTEGVTGAVGPTHRFGEWALPPVTVIATLSRREMAVPVMQAFARQAYAAPARLLVVESGAAVGCISGSGKDLHVTQAGPSAAAARNAGLDWLRKNGGGPWAFFDDDDYYGPDYLSSQISLMFRMGAHVVAKTWQYVMLPDGLHRFQNAESCWTSEFLAGGTLCGESPESVPRFRDVMVGEDVAWCEDARKAGLRVFATGRSHYCYDRSRDLPRAWDAAPVLARRGLGQGRESEFYGKVPHKSVDNVFLRPIGTVPAPTRHEILEAV